MPTSDSTLIKEIRDNYQCDYDRWRDIRDEARTDMRYLLGDPWTERDRAAREEFDRPCIALDELHQYVNQLLNDVRQNKRSIKVMPRGEGSNDKTAELRENRIRRIEYDSNAQQAYITAFEGAVQRSYGCFRLNTAYESDASFDQKLVIRRIANPDSVLFDWDCKELDCSDADHLTAVDIIPREQFKRKYPRATRQSFTAEDSKAAPAWIRERDIMVAEYWKVIKTPEKLYLVETGTKEDSKPMVFTAEDLKNELRPGPVIKEREIMQREVRQYVTNGIEILEDNEWAGKWIPFVPVFGKELYVDTGSGSERKLLSLVRLARDPYMLYCFYRSCQAEVVGQSPKSLYLGYEGQFEGHEEEWENINRSPRPYAQVKGTADPLTGQILPLPRREQYDPPIQALEMGAEGARRAIQAAMGITPLPTAAQRQNEKSGIALQRIANAEDQGTFHFIDNYTNSLRFAGVVANDLLDKIEDTPRTVGLSKRDGTHESVRLHDASSVNAETGQPEMHEYGGEHDVAISTGPSYQSEREEASEFADTILQNIEQLPLDPATKAKFLALVIKLRNIGVIGDEMAELLSPDQGSPQMALGQAQQKLAMQTHAIAEMQAELQKLQLEKAGKVIQGEYQKELAKLNNDVKVLIANTTTMQQKNDQRTQMFLEYWKETHGAAHEAGMQAADQAHQRDMASQQQAAQAQQQQQAQLAEQNSPEAQP